VKGLPSGYNRDLQEDRRPLLETGPLVRGALDAVALALPHVHFDGVRSAAGLADGSTQATDLAEALVRRGVPFREAYKAVGALVRHAVDRQVPLASIDAAIAATFHPALDATALKALEPGAAMRAKQSLGGTSPESVREQIELLSGEAERLAAIAANTPTLATIAARIAAEPLEPA